MGDKMSWYKIAEIKIRIQAFGGILSLVMSNYALIALLLTKGVRWHWIIAGVLFALIIERYYFKKIYKKEMEIVRELMDLERKK